MDLLTAPYVNTRFVQRILRVNLIFRGFSGLVPDIVFNPHGFPSRMTIAMMIEIMAGKSAALHGLVHDASPFRFVQIVNRNVFLTKITCFYLNLHLPLIVFNFLFICLDLPRKILLLTILAGY